MVLTEAASLFGLARSPGGLGWALRGAGLGWARVDTLVREPPAWPGASGAGAVGAAARGLAPDGETALLAVGALGASPALAGALGLSTAPGWPGR